MMMFFGVDEKFPKSQTKRRQVSHEIDRLFRRGFPGGRKLCATFIVITRAKRDHHPHETTKNRKKRKERKEKTRRVCTSCTVDEHLNRSSRPEIGSHHVLQTFRGVDVHEQSRGFIHAFGVWVHRTERGGHFDGKFWSVVGVGVVISVVECF